MLPSAVTVIILLVVLAGVIGWVYTRFGKLDEAIDDLATLNMARANDITVLRREVERLALAARRAPTP